MRSTMLLVVFALASPVGAVAQPLPLQPGQRVRVTVPTAGLSRADAEYRQMAGDSLVVLVHPVRGDRRTGGVEPQSSRVMQLPLSAVTRLEAYRGRHTSGGRAMQMGGFGTVLGAVFGTVIGASFDQGCSGSCMQFGAYGGFVIGAGAGFVVGALAGALIESDRWDDVRVDRLRVSIAPTRNGVGLGASIGF
jgi:hypothetical protein